MPSLVNTLRRCHSTVRVLRKSRALISGLDSPSRASRAICRSWAVRSSCGAGCPLSDVPAGRLKFLARALRERLHPDRGEHLVSRAQLLARVHPAVLAAQPLTVEQVRAGELGPQLSPAEPLDRFAVQTLRGPRFGHQRTGTRLDPQPEVGAAGLGEFRQRFGECPG